MPKITRRRFVATASAAVLSGAVVARYARHLEEEGEPLIEAPANPRQTLLVHPEFNFELAVPTPFDCIPHLSWRDLLRWMADHPYAGPAEAEFYRAAFRVQEHALDEACDWDALIGFWGRCMSGSSGAFRLLQEVGVWPHEGGGREETIGLTFQDWPYVPGGPEVLAVRCDGELAVSLLQHRLNQLGADAAIVFA